MTDWTHSSCKVPMVDRKEKNMFFLKMDGSKIHRHDVIYNVAPAFISWFVVLSEKVMYILYIYMYTYMYNYVSWCIIICNVYACSHIKSQSQHVTIGSPHFLPRAPERRAVRSSAGHRQPRSSPGDERFFCNGTFMENSLGSDRFMVFKPLTMSMDWLKGHF